MDWLPTMSEWKGTLYQRVVDALSADIASGRLVRGQKLPTLVEQPRKVFD